MATTTSLEEPRIRFNSGFWDAVRDARNGERDRRGIPAGDLFCLNRQAPVYAAGYAAGFDAVRDGDSIDEWHGSMPYQEKYFGQKLRLDWAGEYERADARRAAWEARS